MSRWGISDEVPDFEIEDPDFETFAGISDENNFEFEDEVPDFENEVPDFETVEDMSTRKNGKQFADEVPDFENEDFARHLCEMRLWFPIVYLFELNVNIIVNLKKQPML